MVNKWLEALKEKEGKHNTSAASRGDSKKLQTSQNPTSKTSNTPDTNFYFLNNTQKPASKASNTIGGASVKVETPLNPTSKTSNTPTEAERLGLIARWSIEFGYVSLHDPTTGEWHDLRTEEAPDWAKREAFKRKELYRGGNRKAYRLTAREMEEIWEAERTEMWEHLDESSARPDDDKRDDLLYEDDLEREDQC